MHKGRWRAIAPVLSPSPLTASEPPLSPLTSALAFFAWTACSPTANDHTRNHRNADTGGEGDADTDSDSDSDSDTLTTAWGGRMLRIPAGTFTMGGGAGDPDGWYQDHEVTLTHDYWIGATEVTRGQWESFSENAGWEYASMPDYPCTTSTTVSDCPADSVSWYDAAKYANALSTMEGLTPCYLADGTDRASAYLDNPYSCPGYRLPTEAEWEYAARLGEDRTFSGSDTSTDVAWTAENSNYVGTYAHEVATLAPNTSGLYDMSGDVQEWTNDWGDRTYGGYGDGSAQVDPAGPASSSWRVYRGGSWITGSVEARVSFREWLEPDAASLNQGFRLSISSP